MKKLSTLLVLVSFALIGNAQVLTWSPNFIQETSMPVTITGNANYGNQGLKGYNPFDVYVHIGVITNLSKSSADWKYVRGIWPSTLTWEKATVSATNIWKYTIDSTTSLKSYFGITNPNEHIMNIAMLFRSGNGNLKLANSDGSDMYIPVYSSNENVRIDLPFIQPTYNISHVTLKAKIGDNIPIVANASLAGSTVSIYFNGNLLTSATGTKDSANATITKTGTQTIIATATNGTSSSSDTMVFYIAPTNTVAALPAGVTDGINYEPGDTSATVVLYAPNKNHIILVGDFNDWVPQANYQMNVTPDGNRFWLRLTGLTSGTEYAYQYLIDDSLQVADYNSDKILDKYVDPQIPATTYPNLKAFPTKAAGSLVSVLQTAQTPFTWQVPNFTRPDKRNLMIYELWVKDFVYSENWQALTDTLFYLKKLGVNAVEIMPFNNFEGYSSWGYNSNFFSAPDKVYGTRTAFRQFVDACHLQGMAVIMDLAMADVSGSSPLASMYWNSAKNIPAANNPWLNANATNGNVVGSQFNHSSQATIDLRNRTYKHWLIDYNLDGFRLDLFGGYTQNSSDGSYDATRVSNAANINASMQSISPGSYCILESFEPENADQVNKNGVLVWGAGKLISQMSQADEGYSSNSDIVGSGLYSAQGCNQAGIVDYQESHDEVRVMYNIEQSGNTYNANYNPKTVTNALNRAAMGTSLWALMPGPKMIWMFGELGYDYGDAACSNGTNTCGRLDPKPLPWANYYQDPNRKALYTIYSKLLNLRNAYPSTFVTSSSTNYSTSGVIKWMNVWSSTLQVTVFGNFDIVQQSGTVSFPSLGTWYNLFTGATYNVNNYNTNVTLNPGEYYVYVNLAAAVTVPVSWIDFSAEKGFNNIVKLSWSVADEININHYEIERSIDGVNFNKIGSIIGKTSSFSTVNYTYIDNNNVPAGNVYYRIKEVDNNGKTSTSKVIVINSDVQSNLWYSTVTGNNLIVFIKSDIGKTNISVHDISGRILYQQKISNAITGQQIVIPSNQFAKGVYIIKVDSESGSKSNKIVIQ